MRWKKIILVFFGVFLVSQLVASPIYAQQKEYDAQEPESDIVNIFGFSMKRSDIDIASLYVELVSAATFVGTIIFLIIDYSSGEYQTKLQVRQMRDDAYSQLREHHHDLIRLQIERPKLMEIFEEKEKPKEYEGKNSDEIKLNPLEMQIFNFYLAEFDLYERVYLLFIDPEFKKIDDAEWITWLLYLEQISHHWLFVHTLEKSGKLFDEKMIEQIKSSIIEQPNPKLDLESKLDEITKEQNKQS